MLHAVHLFVYSFFFLHRVISHRFSSHLCPFFFLVSQRTFDRAARTLVSSTAASAVLIFFSFFFSYKGLLVCVSTLLLLLFFF